MEQPMANRITSKGQVTIPKPVRDFLRAGPGSAITFDVGPDGRVYVQLAGPEPRQPSRFERLRGAAGPGMTTDEIMALTRGG